MRRSPPAAGWEATVARPRHREKTVTTADYLPQQLYATSLWRLTAALNSSLDLQTVLRTATELVKECTGAERALILLLDGGGELPPEAPGDESRRSRTILQRALAGESVLATDGEYRDGASGRVGDGAKELDPLGRPVAPSPTRPVASSSVLCVPLAVQGRVIGALYLESRAHRNRFDIWHREMASAFANHAAVAIENARLYGRLQEDFEERLRLQQELAEAEKRRATSEETSRAKSELIAHVAHELRSPLNTIRGFTETLIEDGEHRFDEAERSEIYETIAAEADRLLALISRMLDRSCLEVGKPLRLYRTWLDVEAILRRMARSVPYLKGFDTERHRLEVCVPAALPRVEADEDKLFQVLHNLVSNAVKCSPQGGTILLDARVSGNEIRVRVADQGFGIAAEEMERLFQPYCTLGDADRPRAAGTGLGLYLSRYLMLLHGGDLWAESEPGKGSCFTFSLPLA
jgi:two-component system, sensor histidine kinase ChiS